MITVMAWGGGVVGWLRLRRFSANSRGFELSPVIVRLKIRFNSEVSNGEINKGSLVPHGAY